MAYEEILCDANNLYAAYKASLKSSKWKEQTQRFEVDYLRNIFFLQDDLKLRTLQNGPVYEFELRERGRVRPIASLPMRDRIVRHVLCDNILLPIIKRKIIYDNGSSVKDRGLSFSRKRFEVHLRKYYREYKNQGYILFGDFSKFYDNIIHEIALEELLTLVQNDEYIMWLLSVIFDGFKIDVSFLSEQERKECLDGVFNKLAYRKISKEKMTGEHYMYKSINLGDQLSAVIGMYYPHRIDTYVKYVRHQKYYGRYTDDWYIMNPSKEELLDILGGICEIADSLGIHINKKKTRIVKIGGSYRYLQIKYTLSPSGKIVKQINPKRVRAMRQKLKKLARKVDTGELDYERVESMFRGWMGSFYKIIPKGQRQNLIALFEELFGKKIQIVNKKMVITDREEERGMV